MRKEPVFIVDFMLGRLARWLRILGYNAEYVPAKQRKRLILDSLRENRIIITRDTGMSAKRALKLVLIKSDRIAEQLRQLVSELGLTASVRRLFSRCSDCNCPVEAVADKELVRGTVPEYVFRAHSEFSACPRCKKVFWRGTHRELLAKQLEKAGIGLEQ